MGRSSYKSLGGRRSKLTLTSLIYIQGGVISASLVGGGMKGSWKICSLL